MLSLNIHYSLSIHSGLHTELPHLTVVAFPESSRDLFFCRHQIKFCSFFGTFPNLTKSSLKRKREEKNPIRNLLLLISLDNFSYPLPTFFP